MPNALLQINTRITCVGLGNEDYLASMRRVNEKGFFDKEWSANTKPASRVRAVVKKLTSLGAEVSLDEDGDVRRVTFIAARLSRPLVDNDLADLEELEQLEVLSLGGNHQLTDAGLKYLQPLRKLKALNLANTNLKNQVFGLLKSWTELVELALPYGITSSGFKKLKNAKQLETLQFKFQEEQGLDLTVLAQVPSLRRLWILGPLGDEHLAAIFECSALEELTLTLSKTTKGAIKRLCKTRPDIEVSVC